MYKIALEMFTWKQNICDRKQVSWTTFRNYTFQKNMLLFGHDDKYWYAIYKCHLRNYHNKKLSIESKQLCRQNFSSCDIIYSKTTCEFWDIRQTHNYYYQECYLVILFIFNEKIGIFDNWWMCYNWQAKVDREKRTIKIF